MPQVSANGITIEYEIAGPQDGPVLLMIHGLGAQLVRWPQELCDGFVAAGFRIVRFDNRDVGLSTHFDHAPVPDLAAVIEAKRQGRAPDLPYTLSDMAADAAGLLDALGIEAAHVFGVSLGGMIAQMLAIEHPSRVRSLALVMTQSGNPDLPHSNPEALAMLSRPSPDPQADREGYLAHQVALNRALGSPLYPVPEDELRRMAALTGDRAYYPAGSGRQLAASRGSADRSEALTNVDRPTLVIHGADDPLILPVCGDQLASCIAGAWLVKAGGMGHDLPAELTGLFVNAVSANCARASA